jgi:hypothetical protein
VTTNDLGDFYSTVPALSPLHATIRRGGPRLNSPHSIHAPMKTVFQNPAPTQTMVFSEAMEKKP